jgi:hypothetical protein
MMKTEIVRAGPVTTFTKRTVETVRMRSLNVTEINNSAIGAVVADAEGYFNVPIEMLECARLAGLVPAPKSNSARLRDVFAAISALDDGSLKTALWAATTAESLKVASQRAA